MVDELLLEDEKTIRIFVDPLHQRMLFALIEHGAQTSAGLARLLDDEAARMHYHLKRMEDAGLLELDHEERINGIKARFLRPSARNYALSGKGEKLNAGTRGDILSVAKHHLDEAYGHLRANVEDQSKRPDGKAPLDAANLRVGMYVLRAEQMRALQEELRAIELKYDQVSEENQETKRQTGDPDLLTWHLLLSVARKLDR